MKKIGHICTVCSQIITGEVYVIDDSFYCEQDFEVTILVIFLPPFDFKTILQKLASSKPCASCGENISPDDSLAVGETAVFHHACFTCQVCKKNMEGKSVILDASNKVYCSHDYER